MQLGIGVAVLLALACIAGSEGSPQRGVKEGSKGKNKDAVEILDLKTAAQTPRKSVNKNSGRKEKEEIESFSSKEDTNDDDGGKTHGVEDFGNFGSQQQGTPQFISQGESPYTGGEGIYPNTYSGSPQYIPSGQFQGGQFSQIPISQGQPGQFSPGQFSGAGISANQLAGGQQFDGRFSGEGPTTTGFPIVSQGARSQFSGNGQIQAGPGPQVLSSGVNNGDGTYTPSVELDGFSEDNDEDGYVDAFPQRDAQAQKDAPVVKTPQGVRLGGPQNAPGLGGNIQSIRAQQGLAGPGPAGQNALRIQNNPTLQGQGQIGSVPGSNLTPEQLQTLYQQGGIPVGPGGIPLQGGQFGQFGGPGAGQFNPNGGFQSGQFGQGQFNPGSIQSFNGIQGLQGQGQGQGQFSPQGFNPNGPQQFGQFNPSQFQQGPQSQFSQGPQFSQFPIQQGPGQQFSQGSPGQGQGISGQSLGGQGGQPPFVQLPGGIFPQGQQISSSPQFTSQPGQGQPGQSGPGVSQFQGQQGISPFGRPQSFNGQQFTSTQNFIPGQQGGQIPPQFLQGGGGQFGGQPGVPGQFSSQGIQSANFPFDYNGGGFGGPFGGPQQFGGQPGIQGGFPGAGGFQGGQIPGGQFQGQVQGGGGAGGQGSQGGQGQGSSNGLRAVLLSGENRGVISGQDEAAKAGESSKAAGEEKKSA